MGDNRNEENKAAGERSSGTGGYEGTGLGGQQTQRREGTLRVWGDWGRGVRWEERLGRRVPGTGIGTERV